MVLRWVGAITLIALGIALALALVKAYTPIADRSGLDRLSDLCLGLVEAGFGAIVGLLGGKNL